MSIEKMFNLTVIRNKSLLRPEEIKKDENSYRKKSNKMQECIETYYVNLCEAQHVLGYTPPIIRRLKLH
jgi:hypothetical protein